MSNTIRLSIPMTGAILAAPRRIWLAALGAAAVTRDWADKEAAAMFSTLVKEGSIVESRAMRVVGRRLETSMERVNVIARDARHGVTASVESLARIARARFPRVRASIDVEAAAPKRAAKSAKPARRAEKTRTASRSRAGSRTRK